VKASQKIDLIRAIVIVRVFSMDRVVYSGSYETNDGRWPRASVFLAQ
jgi:hypothetical protein